VAGRWAPATSASATHSPPNREIGRRIDSKRATNTALGLPSDYTLASLWRAPSSASRQAIEPILPQHPFYERRLSSSVLAYSTRTISICRFFSVHIADWQSAGLGLGCIRIPPRLAEPRSPLALGTLATRRESDQAIRSHGTGKSLPRPRLSEIIIRPTGWNRDTRP
jgi:hypothetical protein